MERSGKQNFIIDGFPRNKDNLDGWNREMAGLTKIMRVLFFNCSDEVSICLTILKNLIDSACAILLLSGSAWFVLICKWNCMADQFH